ncbi:MAG: serine/threonine-protein phosphatase, partial [Bacteroidales bacterium]|nr:serine/threonine-protein phosphatase [Bacteroidales bacterium]
SVIRFIAGLGLNPEQIVTRINHTFYATNSSSMFVTLFVGTVDLDTMEMSICNAGHNPILLMDPDEGPRYFKAHTNVAAGLVGDFPYQGETVMLKPGTRILLYTDGVTEAENVNQEQYGEQRLLDFAAARPASLTAREWVEALTASIRDFAGKAPQNDDVTIVYIKL